MSGGSTLVVVAAVILRGGRVLISQRPSTSGHAGCWEFPGGKREPGESDERALHRELLEELAVDLPIGPRLFRATAGPLDLRFHRCRWTDGQRPRTIGVVQFRWIRVEDLPGYRFPPVDTDLVRRLAMGALR